MITLFISSFIVSSFIVRQAYAAVSEPPSAGNASYLYQLSYSDAEEAIAQGLSDKGAGDKLSVAMNGRKNGPLFSYNKPVSVEIRGLQFEKMAHRWTANLLVTSGADVVTAMPVGGRFEEMMEVPVLKREVRSGTALTAADIEIRDFPASQVRPDTVNDIASLIGKSPVRSIAAARPIRLHEIENPAVVKKNGIVQMHYQSPGMQITATGQALTDGAKGDVIDVRNTTSRKNVRAVVVDANNVSILAPGVQTSQLTGASYEAN